MSACRETGKSSCKSQLKGFFVLRLIAQRQTPFHLRSKMLRNPWAFWGECYIIQRQLMNSNEPETVFPIAIAEIDRHLRCCLTPSAHHWQAPINIENRSTWIRRTAMRTRLYAAISNDGIRVGDFMADFRDFVFRLRTIRRSGRWGLGRWVDSVKDLLNSW
jgi:hypothetical protein